MATIRRHPVLAEKHYQQQDDENQGGEPPEPVDTLWLHPSSAAEFFLDEFFVVECFIGQAEFAGVGFFGPAGLVIGAAGGAAAGPGGNPGAAMRAEGRGHGLLSTADAGVFFVGLQFHAHEDIIVGDGLHVFDVIA